jgi:hypothetical protein
MNEIQDILKFMFHIVKCDILKNSAIEYVR